MKRKGYLISAFTASLLLCAGGILLGAGMAQGGSPVFYYDGDKISVREQTRPTVLKDHVLEETVLESIENLNISVRDARLEIQEGSTFGLEYRINGYVQEPEWSVTDNTLRFKESSQYQESAAYPYWVSEWWGYEPYQSAEEPFVRITIPKDTSFSRVTLESSSGEIKISCNLQAEKIKILSSYGDIYAESLICETGSVESHSGICKIDSIEGGKAELNCYSGSIRLREVKTKCTVFMEYGDLYVSVLEEGSLDAQLHTGNAVIIPEGSLENFSFSLHTGSGKIMMPGGMVMAENEYGEKVPALDYVKLRETKASLCLYTENGDMKVY